MAQWSNRDATSNCVLWVASCVNLAANSTNRDALFGNTTASAFVTGKTVGVFGVDVTEMGVSNGSIVSYTVTSSGSGYSANTSVTVGGNGTANATANATGRISSVNVVLSGNSYSISPTVTVAAPSAITFNANSAVANTTDFITLASNILQIDDLVTYTVAAGNTAITGLTNGSSFFVVSANSTGIKLASTRGGSAIDITAGVNETGHSLTGQTSVAVAVVSGALNKVAHAGWNLRTVGTGGRAGRVQYETLVAMNSMSNSTDAEDTVFKDA